MRFRFFSFGLLKCQTSSSSGGSSEIELFAGRAESPCGLNDSADCLSAGFDAGCFAARPGAAIFAGAPLDAAAARATGTDLAPITPFRFGAAVVFMTGRSDGQRPLGPSGRNQVKAQIGHAHPSAREKAPRPRV